MLRAAHAHSSRKANHGRSVSRCLIQDVADAVAAVLAKEGDWSSTLPKFDEPPSTVAVSLDGTCLLMGEQGWRETMVGTLSFSDRGGARQREQAPTRFAPARPVG